MKSILRFKISSNMLKTIAVIAMVIDHIAFYFSLKMPQNIYLVCRYVGRIAMPIFVYLLVQGFYHTKSFKKYILRIGVCAIITQILLTTLMILNKKFYPLYTAANRIYSMGNILFTFVLCLLAMKIMYEDVLIKKWNHSKNLSLKVVLIFVIIVIAILVPLDYGKDAVVLTILFYFIERFKIKAMINKNNVYTIKGSLLKIIPDNIIECVYVLLILLSLIVVCISFNLPYTFVLAILPIALYSGEKGKCNNFVKYMYYIIFPLQHVALYLIAMLT